MCYVLSKFDIDATLSGTVISFIVCLLVAAVVSRIYIIYYKNSISIYPCKIIVLVFFGVSG